MAIAKQTRAEHSSLSAEPFVPRPPWLGGDLQTLRNFMIRASVDLSPWPGRRVMLPLADGSGDRLVAMLHEPEPVQPLPCAVLIHGLTGCEDSSYVRGTARHLLSLGYPVVRLNLRGAGPARPLCRFQYHAGRSEDLGDALVELAKIEPAVLDPGPVLIGYSLGGNMLLKFLAEHAAGEGAAVPLRLAAVISAPIDLKATQERMMAPRNGIYQRYLLDRMRTEATGGAAEVSAEEREEIGRARSVYEFDDCFIAPRNGFAGADDYYRRCSSRQFLDAIATPTLVVHALDDPWIPAACYLDYDWQRAPAVTPLLPESGGHVGFHGRGGLIPWHDRAVARFIAETIGSL